MDVIKIKIKESKPQMQTSPLAEGLTLVVLPDQSQADVDETKKEKVVEEQKAVDPARKSELQMLNLVMFFVMLFANGAS